MARITGKFASLHLGAGLVKAIDLFDVAFEGVTEVVTASIKGDKFERVIPSHGSARITAQAYVTNFAFHLQDVHDSADDLELLDFRMDLVDGSALFTTVTGSGYVSRVTLSAPRGLVVQNFEMVVDGSYVVTVA